VTTRPDTKPAVIAGGGLGGLFTAALLCQKGIPTLVLERLSALGGRFTSKHVKGFQIGTGALHALPHGSRGPAAQLIRQLGLHIEIADCVPRCGVLRFRDREIYAADVMDAIKVGNGLLEQAEVVKIVTCLLRMKRCEGTLHDWFLAHSGCENLYRAFNGLCAFALGMSCRRVSVMAFVNFMKDVRRFGGPGLIRGGCKGLVHELERYVLCNGGTILREAALTHVRVTRGKVSEITFAVGGQTRSMPTDFLVSSIDPASLRGMIDGEEPDESLTHGLDPLYGIKVSFWSERPLLGHSGVLFPLGWDNVSGVVEPTNADPAFAPAGKSLLIAYHVLESKGANAQIEGMLSDLSELFPEFARERIVATQVYSGRYPVNWAPTGEGIAGNSQIRGLHFVGDAVNAPHTMAERVAASAQDAAVCVIREYTENRN